MTKTLSQHPGAAAARNDHIDTLRGLACLLLVFYHVVGHNPTAGLEVDYDHILRRLVDSLTSIRMPLFTVLSGYVYALRPLSNAGAAPKFMQGKIRRLLIPLFVVGGANAILMGLMSNGFSPLLATLPFKALIVPHSVYWFLNALFLIFILIAILEVLGALNGFRNWLTIFTFTCAIFFIVPHAPTAFGIGGALFLLPFFLLGLGLCRFSNILLDTRFQVPVVFAAITLFTFQQFRIPVHHFDSPPLLLDIYLHVAVGVSTTWALVLMAPQWRPLAWIGASSYAIYLFHVFGVFGGRELSFLLLPQGGLPLAFALSMIAGVIGPLVVEAIAKRFALTRTAFLGLRFAMQTGPQNKQTPLQTSSH